MRGGVEEGVEQDHPLVLYLEYVIDEVVSGHVEVKEDSDNRYLKLFL